MPATVYAHPDQAIPPWQRMADPHRPRRHLTIIRDCMYCLWPGNTAEWKDDEYYWPMGGLQRGVLRSAVQCNAMRCESQGTSSMRLVARDRSELWPWCVVCEDESEARVRMGRG